MSTYRNRTKEMPEILGTQPYIPTTGCTLGVKARSCDFANNSINCKNCGWNVECIKKRKEDIEAGKMVVGEDGLRRLFLTVRN